MSDTITCPSAETKAYVGERVTVTDVKKGVTTTYSGIVTGVEASHTTIRTDDGEFCGVKFRIRTSRGHYRTTHTLPDRGAPVVP